MFNRFAVAWAFAGLCTFGVNAQTLPPVEAFGNLPEVSAPRLSPDGKRFALIRSVSGRPAAVIFETNPTPESKPAVILAPGNVIDYVQWAKNDCLIIVVKQGYTQTFDKLRTWRRAFAVDIHGQNMVKLLRNQPTLDVNLNGANVIDVNLDDPDSVLMTLVDFKVRIGDELHSRLVSKQDDGSKLDIIKVNVRTGDGSLEKSGDYRTVDWNSDGHGTPTIEVYETRNPLQEHVSALRNGTWSDFGAYDASGDRGAGVAGLTEDGKALVQTVLNEKTISGLVATDIATGSKTPLYFADQFDLDEVLTDEWTGRVIGVRYVGDKTETRYFDSQRQALQNGLETAFKGLQVKVVSWDVSKNHVVVETVGPQQPALYYYLDRTTHQTTLLADTYSALQPSNLGEMKPYNYAARDGLAVPAYLTLPPGKAPKNLPVVVFPHGGPDRRDSLGFDWMAQFLANRGYAVLQPNFRGSSGYGHKFTEAGLHQWGLKIQDDITDGVVKLIADGIADPKRICIVGASFGGYAALAGATFTPDLYACAASWAGVSDLPAQLSSATGGIDPGSQATSFWTSRMGDDLVKLDAASPARRVGTVKCPILLMHGEGDTTVRIEQSELEQRALVAAGKRVTFVRFPGEDHYMNVADTRIRMLTELEKFLAANIGR